MNGNSRISNIRDNCRANLLKFTKQAFNLLPALSNPRILDIGCGSGVATIELARLSGGEIDAIDIDMEALKELDKKAQAQNLRHKIKVLPISMLDSNYPSDNYDLIWSEGSISFLGFQAGLKKWRPYLKSDGYLVVHDCISRLSQKEKLIPKYGFIKLGQFVISQEVWWNEYFAPLKKQLDLLPDTNLLTPLEKKELNSAQREIKGFSFSDDNYASVFFIMKKTEIT